MNGSGGVDTLVQQACGDRFDELVQLMRDRAVPPMSLWVVSAEASFVAAAHRDCVAATRALLQVTSAARAEQLRSQLPWHLKESSDLAEALVEDALRESYFRIDESVFSARLPDQRTYRAHPELLPFVDEDGLLALDGFDARSQVVFHRESALQYHPLLRRHFTSHINDTLIATLLKVVADGRATGRIALNEQNFMPRAEFSEYLEFDYWFGPPLTETAIDDPRQTGVTVFGDPETGLTHEYPRLFVDWRLDKEGNKVVQIEELSEHSSSDVARYRVLRYLHAIRDTRTGHFIHCDGAVRAYTQDEYQTRKKLQFVTGRTSCSRYRKLFRLDGAISTDEWSNIAAQWFRHNKLILEYLDALK